MTWSTESASDFKRDLVRAERLTRARATIGPCPNCGAPANVDLIEVSIGPDPDFIPGYVECSAQCWKIDPDAYIAAVRNSPR